MTTTTKPPDTKSRRFINELQPGELIQDEVFLVHQKDLRTTSNGSLYVHLVLSDRTGQILARIWNATRQQYESIPEGGFLRVRGRIESYKGNLQFIVDGLRAAEPAQRDMADFLPATERDVEEMWNHVLAIVRTIKNPHLLTLISAFVKDEKIAAGFKKSPAAVQLHHAYIGGLLEHTLNVLELACRIFGKNDDSDNQYPKVSRDLVLAGLFLHDIGKTAELAYETNFTYTTPGQLVGHITQAAVWIDQKIADIEEQTGKRFPQELQDVLTHIILAHHGSYEFGSPRLPAVPEAIVVHYLDNIDAKLDMFLTGIKTAKNADSDWTEYIKPLETRVFKKDVMGAQE